MSCLGGHGQCKQKSLVCRVHKHGSYVRGQHFHFESSDADKLNNVQRHKLRTKSRNGEETAVSLITNKVEAMHLRSIKLCPKHKLTKSTYRWHCLNAVLLDSIGFYNSILVVGESMDFSFGIEARKALANYKLHRRDNMIKKDNRVHCSRTGVMAVVAGMLMEESP